MTFLHPEFLWTGLLLLPLAAIYLFKVKPRKVSTSAWFLWHTTIEQKQSTAFFQKFRDLFSLILMLLAFILVILALAGLKFNDPERNRDLVLIIDTSASMSAKQGHSTRLDAALAAARSIINALDTDRQVVVMSADQELHHLVSRTNNRRLLEAGLDLIRPSHLPFRRDAVISMIPAQPQAQTGDKTATPDTRPPPPRPRFILISAAAFPGSEQLGPVELLKVGSSTPNVGITGFDLVRLPGPQPMLGLFFRLASAAPEPVKLTVELRKLNPDAPASPFAATFNPDAHSVLVKICPVTVQPGLNAPETFTVADASPGRWLLLLKHTDALDLDNCACAVVAPVVKLPCAAYGDKAGFFLSRCLAAFAGENGTLDLTTVNPELAIADACAPPPAVIRAVIFNPTGASPFWKSVVPQAKPDRTVNILAKDHPALRFCDPEGISFATQKRIVPPDDAFVLLEAADHNPLLYKTTQNGRTAYVVNLDPLESEFVLNPTFPILAYSLLRDLAGIPDASAAALKTGTQLPADSIRPFAALPNPPAAISFQSPDTPSITMSMPSGAEVSGSAESTLPLPLLNRIGFHELADARLSATVAASLFSAPDTLLNSTTPDSLKPVDRGGSLRYWLLLAALLIFTTECILYHRRLVG